MFQFALRFFRKHSVVHFSFKSSQNACKRFSFWKIERNSSVNFQLPGECFFMLPPITFSKQKSYTYILRKFVRGIFYEMYCLKLVMRIKCKNNCLFLKLDGSFKHNYLLLIIRTLWHLYVNFQMFEKVKSSILFMEVLYQPAKLT